MSVVVDHLTLAVCLARLTLSNSMMRQETECLKSNLLILDEPTDGFSKTQLSKVKDYKSCNYYYYFEHEYYAVICFE